MAAPRGHRKNFLINCYPMKKLFLLFSLLLTAYINMPALQSLKNETIKYRIMYKWGLINKQAGTASIILRDQGDRYFSQLVGHSAPWADKFFMVRDTLNGIMDKKDYRPHFYEKIAHEGDDHKHDTVRFTYKDNTVIGESTRKVVKKGEEKPIQKLTLEAEGTTVDMLSSFYLMRTLPYEKWQPGHGETVTIFSGKQKETLTFKYKGIEIVQIDNKRYQCYHVTFVFTGKGGKKTSDNMDAWITTGSQRVPVKLEGKLPVGKVRCEIIN